MNPAIFGQRVIVRAELAEWENRLKIHYLITDADSGTRLTRASSVQVAVRMDNREMQLVSPACPAGCRARGAGMMARGKPWVRRIAAALLLAASAAPAWAFDLNDLQAQLREAPVVRGQFVQQKYLRSLPQPLTSTGLFTLSSENGLLWELRAPLHQDLLLTPSAIFRRDDGGKWQALPQAVGAGRETRMFLTVLSGDTKSLQDNFDIALERLRRRLAIGHDAQVRPAQTDLHRYPYFRRQAGPAHRTARNPGRQDRHGNEEHACRHQAER